MMEKFAQAGDGGKPAHHYHVQSCGVRAPAECCVGDTAKNVKRCQPLSPIVFKICKRCRNSALKMAHFKSFLTAVADSA